MQLSSSPSENSVPQMIEGDTIGSATDLHKSLAELRRLNSGVHVIEADAIITPGRISGIEIEFLNDFVQITYGGKNGETGKRRFSVFPLTEGDPENDKVYEGNVPLGIVRTLLRK